MVELIEYVLVFGVTASLTAFSLMVVSGALPILGQSQSKAQLEEIEGAAGLAALKGNATIVLPLSDVSLSCSDGQMSLSSGSSLYSSPVTFPCSFSYSKVSCLCTLSFSLVGSSVQLKVEG